MTPTAINSLQATGRRYEARDKAKTGLLVRVGSDGSLRWGFRSRIKTGLKGRSPEFRDSFGAVAFGAGSKPDRVGIEAAKQWAIALKALTDAGINPRHTRNTLAAAPTLFDMWLHYRDGRQSQQKAQSSQEADERLWRLHIEPRFGSDKIAAITTPQIALFYDDKKANGRNANQIMALLSVIMSNAVRYGAIPINPCREIRREKERAINWERLETPQQRIRLIEEAYQFSEEAGLIIEIALKTGARKQEILTARWDNITPRDDGSALWVIPNTKQKRAHRAVFPQKLYRKLRAWQERGDVSRLHGWVFPSSINEDSPREDVKGFYSKVRRQIGKPRLRFHDLRHDFGTQLAIEGMTATNIMAAMGHSSLQTTMRYIDLAEAETASEASKMREKAIERWS